MKKLIVSLVLVTVGIFAVCQLALAQAVPVDLELSLLIDVSGSVDNTEFNLQRTGYVNAFNNSSIVTAIQNGTYGKIAANFIYWSGAGQEQQAVGWTLISNATTASNFASAINTSTRPYYDLTAPGNAINYAYPLFGTNSYDGTRQVIDVSGDGEENDGANTAAARNAALGAGIDTINGITIGGGTALHTWYQNNIMGGTDAFVVSASGFDTFGDAVYDKIYREVTGGGGEVPEPATMLLLSAGLAGLGFIRRKR